MPGVLEVDKARSVVSDEKGATVRVQSEEKLEPGPARLALAPAAGPSALHRGAESAMIVYAVERDEARDERAHRIVTASLALLTGLIWPLLLLALRFRRPSALAFVPIDVG